MMRPILLHRDNFPDEEIHRTWWRHQKETFYALLVFVRGIHGSPVNFPHKDHWRTALMFYLYKLHNRKDGNLRRHRAHCDVTVMNLLAPPLGTIEAWPVSSIPFSTSCGIFRLFTGYKDNMVRMCIWFCCALFCSALFNCGFIIDLRWYYNRVVSDFSRLAWFICMYFSRLLHWHWGRRMIVTVSVKYLK